MLWLPFGFDLGGLIEDWGFFAAFDQFGDFFACTAHSPIPSMVMRPLMIFPYAMVYAFDPNSYYFDHFFLMGEIGLKCFAFAAVVWLLTRSQRLALFSGMLLVLYPADTMQLCTRAIPINLPLSTILLAVAACLYAFESKKPLAQAAFIFTAALLVLFSVLMYEASIVYFALPFFVLFIRLGFVASFPVLWKQRYLLLGWLFPFVLCAVYEILVITSQTTYESRISDPPPVIISHLPLIFSVGFVRSLAGGWFDAFSILTSEIYNYGYLLFMIAVLLWTLFCARYHQPDEHPLPISWSFILRALGAGLALIFLGYLPTIPCYSYSLITQRTYLFSSPGACLVWLCLIMALLKMNRYLAILLGAALLLAGSATQLFQFNHYTRLWHEQQDILKTIVDSAPDLPKNNTLLLLDASDRITDVWMLQVSLSAALSYLYDRPVTTEICMLPGNDWTVRDATGHFGLCVEGADSWSFSPRPAFNKSDPEHPITPPPSVILLKKNITVVKINSDGSSATKHSESEVLSILQHQPVRLARYLHYLATPPWKYTFQLFSAPDNFTQFRWDFGRWWNLDLPTQGTGWHPSEWVVHYFQHDSFAWKTEPTATLLFKLLPDQKTYRLDGSFLMMRSPVQEQNIKIQVNGHDVPLTWSKPHVFTGDITPDDLHDGMNELEFTSPMCWEESAYGLSAALDWVSLHPK